MSRFSDTMNGSRMLLVALGIGLGYVARLVLGGPPVDQPPRTFQEPLKIPDELDEVIDLPLIETEFSKTSDQRHESGLIPPISLATHAPTSESASTAHFEHGTSALFEPHGHRLCASGCAVSRHPTEKLSTAHFQKLLSELENQPLNPTNDALEELLFYGPQTSALLEQLGTNGLSPQRETLLRQQLQYSHAKVSIRVVDNDGTVRTWVDPTTVPLDRRHIFEMKTRGLQNLVTSGTVKRVGLNHLWTRL